MAHNHPLSQPTAPPPSGANYSAEHGCFEGPEKLLEIWFAPTPFYTNTNHKNTIGNHSDSEMSDESSPVTPNESQTNLSLLPFSSDLRTVDRAIWDSMLATVKCTVLSVLQNAHVNAYLLSESSMFVFPHKIVLKTCGTTTLLKAIPYMLEIAKTRCGYESVYRLFYSRKSFMFPDKQPDPHRSWDSEVGYLDSHFDNGASYVIGNTNAEEWYLYLTSPTYQQYGFENITDMQQLLKETGGLSWMNNSKSTSSEYSWTKLGGTRATTPFSINKPHFYNSVISATNLGYRPHDETIEILMTDLHPDAMKPFYHQTGEEAGLVGGKRVDVDTGLDLLYPRAQVDSYLFEPCGYSCNGLSDDGYYTIHVTPEPQCSYASFETTIAVDPSAGATDSCREEAVRTLARQVTDIFRPGSFTITYFASHKDGENGVGKLIRTVDQFAGYSRKDKILYEFEGYDLIFGHYKKI